MKRTNSFITMGWMWVIIGLGYGCDLYKNYGGGCPRSEAEWLGEIHVGLLLIAGTVLIAIGRYLRSERRP